MVGLRQPPYRFGGMVEGLLTTFWVEGSEAELGAFLGHVTAALANLPVDRLSKEAAILRTEQASRRSTPADAAHVDRFGAQGWGLGAYDQFGLISITAAEVQSWASSHFTVENAALYVRGPVPQNLAIALPDGSPRPYPKAQPLRFQTPAWSHHRVSGVGVSILLARSIPALVLGRMLERRALDRLRYVEGVSYEVSLMHQRLDSDQIELMLWADGLREKLGTVRTAMLEVLDELATSGATQEEMQLERDGFAKALADPELSSFQLDSAARQSLAGTEFQDPRTVASELERIDGATLGPLLRDGMESALLIVPDSLSMLDTRFYPLPAWSKERVQGREFRLDLPPEDLRARFNRLVVGEEGVSYIRAPGQGVTVTFANCAAALQWNDGSWTLIGKDAFRVHVRPNDWKAATEISESLERTIPGNIRVSVGDRPVPDPDSLIGGAPRIATPTRKSLFFSPRRDSLWLLIFVITSVRLWFFIDAHPFTGGVDPTASLVSGLLWVFGVVVTIAALYFLYWRYWLLRRGLR